MRMIPLIFASAAAAVLAGCAVVTTAASVTGSVISTTAEVTGDVIGAAARAATGSSKSDHDSD
jgi:phosphate/sulfate permease